MMIKKLVFYSFILLMMACSSGPKEIAYGQDKCDFCTMTIVDKRYGAELVTDKGKVYKFDSFECLLSYQQKNKETTFAHRFTATIDQPATLQDASAAGFLISPNLPSPMGANLTAFSNLELAKEGQLEHQGNIFSYQEIVQWFLKNGQHNPGHTQQPSFIPNHMPQHNNGSGNTAHSSRHTEDADHMGHHY